MKLKPVGGPHIHSQNSVSRTMFLVIVALLPATLWGLYLFGWPAINVLLLCCVTAVVAESLCLRLQQKPQQFYLLDGSALLTGWLVAMTMPPWSPFWLAILASAFAIVIGKQIYGGLGQNPFNPAMVARIALLISFPMEMTTWIQPTPLFAENAPNFFEGLQITFGGWQGQIDQYTGATALSHVQTELGRGIDLRSLGDGPNNTWQLFTGYTLGSLGETSAMLLLLGGLFLWGMGVISWAIPTAMLGTVFVLSTLFSLYDPLHYAGPIYHLFAGSLMMGAIFIATDLVTSPITRRGQILFGIGCGGLAFVIRTWGNYPEGVGFAVLLMNACTPLIDHYFKPRVFGRDVKGAPLNIEGQS